MIGPFKVINRTKVWQTDNGESDPSKWPSISLWPHKHHLWNRHYCVYLVELAHYRKWQQQFSDASGLCQQCQWRVRKWCKHIPSHLPSVPPLNPLTSDTTSEQPTSAPLLVTEYTSICINDSIIYQLLSITDFTHSRCSDIRQVTCTTVPC